MFPYHPFDAEYRPFEVLDAARFQRTYGVFKNVCVELQKLMAGVIITFAVINT